MEESDEEPPNQGVLLLTLLLLCGLPGVTAQEDGVTGEALCHKIMRQC